MLEVSLLGEQYVEGSTATNLARSSRSIALLGFLAVHAEAPQPRQRLAAIFWPDSTEQQARTNLRRELHYLRVLLGEDRSLVVEPATLMWREWPTCRVDVCVFRRERQLALQALAAGDQHAMLEHGTAAVEEYRGDLLPGMYDDWVLVERDELRRQCVELCDQLVAGWRDLGDLKKAVEYGRIRVRLEPLEELGYRTLMELQADAGDRAGAISTYTSAPRSWSTSCKSSPRKPQRYSWSDCSALTDWTLRAAVDTFGRGLLSGRGWWAAIKRSIRSPSAGGTSSRVGPVCSSSWAMPAWARAGWSMTWRKRHVRTASSLPRRGVSAWQGQ